MLNVLSTLAMSGFLAISGGMATINNATTADMVTPNAIVLQITDGEANDDNSEVREFFQTARIESAAEILGLTVAELEEAREDGASMEELLDEAGLTADQFKELMAEAKEATVAEAIENGLITQEQADAFAERQANGRNGRRGGNPEVVAEILGLTVEELEEAREDGISMAELLEDAGLTEDEFREAINAAREDARATRVQEALDNGDITEEEAEALLNGEGRGQRGRGGQRGNN